MVSRSIPGLVAFLLASACGVNKPATNTGGAPGDAGTCGRGVVVASSDYVSTNVSLLDLDAKVISQSVLSSASASTGLSAPLSGDVVLPSTPAHGDRLTLIDRYPASVLTWIDVKTGSVDGQLSVATGFAANPQDYVEISEHLAYVTRYEPNTQPGRQPFDAGNDLLGIDPVAPAIRSRLDLTAAMKGEDGSFLPRAGRAMRVGGIVYALLEGYSADFKRSADSRLVAIDAATGDLASVTVLVGLHNCRGMASSPDQSELAIACSGMLTPPQLEESGVVIVSTEQPPREKQRFLAATFGSTPLAFSVAYASPRTILFGTFGTLPGEMTTDDTFIRLDLGTGGFESLLRSARSPMCGPNERCPFSIGDVVCAPSCAVCFVADAATAGGVVHRLSVSPEGAIERDDPHRIEDGIGLPPRYLELF
jgi:hypothetical protein